MRALRLALGQRISGELSSRLPEPVVMVSVVFRGISICSLVVKGKDMRSVRLSLVHNCLNKIPENNVLG